MKKYAGLFLLFFPFLLVGCGSGNPESVYDPDGNLVLEIDPLPEIRVEQGTTTRGNFGLKPVDPTDVPKVTFGTPPKGVKIFRKEPIAAGTSNVVFTVEAAIDAEMGNKTVEVTFSVGDNSTKKDLKLVITENTAAKEKRREDYLKEWREKYNTAETNRQELAGMVIKVPKKDQKAFSDEVAKLIDPALQAEDALKELKKADINTWTSQKSDLEKAVTEYEKAVQKQLDEAKKKLAGDKGKDKVNKP